MTLDYHRNTIESDPRFHAHMDRLLPNWRELPIEEQRRYAKSYNFLRLYGAKPQTIWRCLFQQEP